jgi:hypothetical protein
MKDFISVSPFKILEKSSRKGLGPGNLGVLIAPAGVGKTACLIHIAFDKIFRQKKLVHISLEEGAEKVRAYYTVMYSELGKALKIPDKSEKALLIDHNRMILAYRNRSFELDRLRVNLKNLEENMGFKADTIIVDGLDFEKTDRGLLEGFKKIAAEFDVEIWFSALSHRHISEINERGIPYPCHRVDDLFSLILQLLPEPSGVFLKMLKDHDSAVITDAHVQLDPNTFLAMDEV